MASNLLLIVLLVLFSLSVTSVYSLSTRDTVSKQEDESYFMATSDQGSSMIDVDDLAKARSLQALVTGSKVVKNKKSKSTSTKSEKGSKKKKKHKSKKLGSLAVSALVGIIIAAIVVTIVIICVLYFFYLRHKTKKAQSIEQEKIKGSSETQTSKTEDHV